MVEHTPYDAESLDLEDISTRMMWGFFGPETVSSQVIQHLTSADVVREIHVGQGCIGDNSNAEWEVYAAVEGGLRFEFEDTQQRLLFEQLDVGVAEFAYYAESLSAIDSITAHMAPYGLADGFNIATKAKLTKLLYEQRQVLLESQSSPALIEKLHYAQRDLLFALSAVTTALSLGSEEYAPADSYAWYKGGHKARNGGYIASYAVCNDEYWPDDIDHAEHLSDKVTDDEPMPDEFHNPGKLEIRVDPALRIEFVYTPEIESARSRHESHSTVTENGRERVYENQSLSIRLDLDPAAPYGVALDIGRSAYDGGRDGRHIKRDSDLLGGVFGDIEEQGSHEYAGFGEASKEEFRNFAEYLTVQLDLQNKNIKIAKLGRAAFREAA